jgi:nucleotide-binding universal stress UspA family protein
VIRQAPVNVAVLVDKGMGELRKVLVPYLGEKQDRGALIAAERLSRLPGVAVTILHVVKPNSGDADRLNVKGEVDRSFKSAASQDASRMQVVESDAPIDLVVEESRRYDLLVLGLAAEWDLQSTRLFGKHESVAQRAHCSLLIVHANALAPVMRGTPIEQTTPQSAEQVTVA